MLHKIHPKRDLNRCHLISGPRRHTFGANPCLVFASYTLNISCRNTFFTFVERKKLNGQWAAVRPDLPKFFPFGNLIFCLWQFLACLFHIWQFLCLIWKIWRKFSLLKMAKNCKSNSAIGSHGIVRQKNKQTQSGL